MTDTDDLREALAEALWRAWEPLGDLTADECAAAVLDVLSERGVLTDAAIGRWLVERLRHTARPVGPNEEMSEPERTEQAYALMELAVAAKRFPALAAGGDAT